MFISTYFECLHYSNYFSRCPPTRNITTRMQNHKTRTPTLSNTGTSRGYAEVNCFDEVPFEKLKLMLPNTSVEMRYFRRKNAKSKYTSSKWVKKCVAIRGTQDSFVWLLITNGTSRRNSFVENEYESFEFGSKEFPYESVFIDLTAGDCEVYKLEEKTKGMEEEFVTLESDGFVFTDNIDRADDKTLVISSTCDKNSKIEMCFSDKKDREVWFNSLKAATGFTL